MPTSVALLPGLDGTGKLFQPLLRASPKNIEAIAFNYPADAALAYPELVKLVEGALPKDCQVLIAESFSGPIALSLVAAEPARFRALVLCATFATSPLPAAVSRLPWSSLFRLPVPAPVLAGLMTGGDLALARTAAKAVRAVDPQVLALRLRQVLDVNCLDEASRCTVPTLYIRASRDRMVRRAVGDRLISALPNASLETVVGPHLILQKEPERCWELISAFWEGAA